MRPASYGPREISGAVKRVIEGEFAHVRVRGEVGRVSRPGSGHLYFDLKDDRSVIAAITWKGQAARLTTRPEEGMEVVAIGRLTTFPGQSKYQMIVDDLRPAGQGALMLMLEKRRQALAAEGLFDDARKVAIPYLPSVIGVVTSPSGAVIRDILHRLRDRFPRQVLIWPVAVQGERCAPDVARAIAGFNALRPGGPIPRPDLIIVARGGGSLEDLWGFNEEIVVRAAAASRIPLISAVGHETDTTLIDFAADRRAPTPTAAAEMAVPVRLDLLAATGDLGQRMTRAATRGLALRRQRLADLSRALPRPDRLTEGPAQRLDALAARLPAALVAGVQRRHVLLARTAAALRPALLRDTTARRTQRLRDLSARLMAAHAARLRADIAAQARARVDLAALVQRLHAAPAARVAALRDRLAGLDRLRQSLGHRATLERGYAVVRLGDQVLTSRAEAAAVAAFEVEFRDGRLSAVPVGSEKAPTTGDASRRSGASGRRPGSDDPQGSLF
ncbi:MAG: exodeoxyribonuclease VII large subunit [Rhodobacteraceae bacterium]|nr:exodeoxyribonuclease VII large subunit [Paracoccaceae bacterium]